MFVHRSRAVGAYWASVAARFILSRVALVVALYSPERLRFSILSFLFFFKTTAGNLCVLCAFLQPR